ncbi:hypothetical protein [Ohtaekwangia koreensis]|nr:hypothetical protein [Ohtaekwangia koreensis]
MKETKPGRIRDLIFTSDNSCFIDSYWRKRFKHSGRTIRYEQLIHAF